MIGDPFQISPLPTSRTAATEEGRIEGVRPSDGRSDVAAVNHRPRGRLFYAEANLSLATLSLRTMTRRNIAGTKSVSPPTVRCETYELSAPSSRWVTARAILGY